ncbi:MAG: DUF2975 domain-containing protein [Bacteroidota bacterium]
MQNIRYKGLINSLRGIVVLALIFEILIAVAVLVIFIITATSEEDALLSAWPIVVAEDQSRYGTVSDNASVIVNQGTIQFSTKSIGYYLLKSVEAIFTFFIVIGITLLLRDILYSLHRQQVFTTENARRIRNISLLIILFTPYSIAKSFIYRGYLISNIRIEGKEYASLFSNFSGELSSNQIWINVDVNIQALLIGVVLLIIAEVFRMGVLIRLDNESIV